MLKNYQDIKEKVINIKELKKIVIANPDSFSVIRALKEVEKYNIAEGLYVGNAENIKSIAKDMDFEIDDSRIYNVTDEKAIAKKSIELIRSGQGDVLMKGMVSTPVLMKAVLDKENGLRTGEVLSHVAVASIPTYHKMLIFSDGGININPDLKTKESIIRSIIQMTKALEIETPKIGCLCPIEKVNPKIQETVDADQLQKMAETGIFGDVIIEGPIAMDVALSSKAATKKGLASKIAGDIDAFLVPNISTGNAVIKILLQLGNAKVGGLVVGARVPIILLSRSDSAEEKLNSIALSILVSLNL